MHGRSRGVPAVPRRSWLVAFSLCVLPSGASTLGCTDTGKISADHAKVHAQFLLKAAEVDIAELKRGLPQGSKHLVEAFKEGVPDGETARKALETARNKVQDLRVAKSTFFALTDKDGTVIRNDQEQDLMVGKNMFKAYPELKKVLTGSVVETGGSMPEAAGVKGKPDAQWVLGVPVDVDGKPVAAYVSGWSWSSYAYRLETALRSDVLTNTKEGGKVPLLYVYVIVDGGAYGAPISPTVNAEAILKQKPLEKATAAAPFAMPLEIEGRQFGLAVVPLAPMGKGAGIAVLRSET